MQDLNPKGPQRAYKYLKAALHQVPQLTYKVVVREPQSTLKYIKRKQKYLKVLTHWLTSLPERLVALIMGLQGGWSFEPSLFLDFLGECELHFCRHSQCWIKILLKIELNRPVVSYQTDKGGVESWVWRGRGRSDMEASWLVLRRGSDCSAPTSAACTQTGIISRQNITVAHPIGQGCFPTCVVFSLVSLSSVTL